jgi:hypothetical protein
MPKRRLSELNKEYEDVLHASTISKHEKSRRFAELMTEMEKDYDIPLLTSNEWEKENKAVIALYRKLSNSRYL